MYAVRLGKLFTFIYGCDRRYHVTRCSGVMATVGDKVLDERDHSHAPDARQLPIRNANQKIREKAATSNDLARRII